MGPYTNNYLQRYQAVEWGPKVDLDKYQAYQATADVKSAGYLPEYIPNQYGY